MERDEAGPEPSLSSPEPPKESSKQPVEPFPVPTREDAERADRLLQEYALAKRRGLKQEATKKLEEANKVAPGFDQVIFAVAEDLVERGQRRLAGAHLKRGMATHPTNVRLERLYAETVLALSPDSQFDGLSDLEVMARGQSAVWLTTIVPGLGQVVTGRTRLGISFFTIWFIGIVWAFLIPNGIAGLMKMMGLNRDPLVDFNAGVLAPLLLAALAHFSAIGEASGYAKRVKPRSIERPVPPVDKPF